MGKNQLLHSGAPSKNRKERIHSRGNTHAQTTHPSNEEITQQCQKVLHETIITDNFRSLFSLIIEIGRRDLLNFELIEFTMKAGCYAISPSRLDSDMKYIFGRIRKFGEDITHYADELSRFSEACYKKHVGPLAEALTQSQMDVDNPSEKHKNKKKLKIGEAGISREEIDSEDDSDKMADDAGREEDNSQEENEAEESANKCGVCNAGEKEDDYIIECSNLNCPFKFYHRGCLRRAGLESHLQAEEKWFCPSCVGDTHDEENNVICYNCHRRYQQDCLEEYTVDMSTEQWICPECVGNEKKRRKSKRSSSKSTRKDGSSAKSSAPKKK